MKKFTIIHTSDWHLGHQLYRSRRDDEFRAFLGWLLNIIAEKQADALLIAGDIFDTVMPPASAQKLYYDFLGQAVKNGCRHIIVTAGNHDSPVFLTAPHELLRVFDIYAAGYMEPGSPVTLLLRDTAGEPACIVSPMPYLREGDLRGSAGGDGDLLAGLRLRYQEAAEAVTAMRREHGDLPAVAMGHLFIAGSSMDNEGERINQMGNLDRAPRDIIPAIYDYTALGHIHRPQAVGGDDTCRYSGSPLPMSFSEHAQHKSAVLLTFAGRTPEIELLPVPQSRRLVRIAGSREKMLEELKTLVAANEPAWVEMQHDGSDAVADLNNEARQLAENTTVNILCIKAQPAELASPEAVPPKDLGDCSEEDIFCMLLDSRNEPEDRKRRLLDTFRALCASYEESLRSGE